MQQIFAYEATKRKSQAKKRVLNSSLIIAVPTVVPSLND